MPTIINPTPAEIAEIIRLHMLWRQGNTSGSRANLSGANLYGADLFRANLFRG
jgi:uncharacterized protein YjbI with pentapeptide repeats